MAIQWSLARTPCTLSFLPATPLSWFQTLDMLFELTLRPSRTHNLASYVASGTPEIQGHSQMCCARLARSRSLLKTTNANLDCTYVWKFAFEHTLCLIVKSQQNRIELVTRPDKCLAANTWCVTSVWLRDLSGQEDRRPQPTLAPCARNQGFGPCLWMAGLVTNNDLRDLSNFASPLKCNWYRYACTLNNPLSGKHFSLWFLSATPLSLSWTLDGLCELARWPLRTLALPRALLLKLLTENLGNYQVWHARSNQDQLTETLIVRLLKQH